MEAPEPAAAHFDGVAKLSNALARLPAQILDHQYSCESFGSWSMTLRYKGAVLRLDFDGRESRLEIRRTRDRKSPYKYESASLLDEGQHFGTLDAEAVEMSTGNPQDPLLHRAYAIRPRPELAERLATIGLADDFDLLGQQTVVMTEAVAFEAKLEGYRALILSKCKEAFLKELFEFLPLSDKANREALFGSSSSLAEIFDLWWTAEEVETIEIDTSW